MKGKSKRIVSGFLSALTIISSIMQPVTTYAAEAEPAAYEAEYPDMEKVKGALAEDEIVTAEDYEVEAGTGFDVKSDFSGMKIHPEKVKVTYHEAKNQNGQAFDGNKADTYHAVYFVEPVSGHPSYHVQRNIVVREPSAEIHKEKNAQDSDGNDQTGGEDAEEGETDSHKKKLSETELNQALEALKGQDTYDEESGLKLLDVMEQFKNHMIAGNVDLLALEEGETVTFTAYNPKMLRSSQVEVSSGGWYYYADYGLGSYLTCPFTVKFGSVTATAYCIQPSKPGPGSGVYEITKLGDGKELSKVCYYGTNASGEDCFFDKKYPDFSAGKRFVVTHLAASYPKYGRIYRTGDYGVLLKSGIIIFQGRKDSQIKIRGHRIEIGEIENQLLKHPKVKNCVVVDWEDDLGKKYLCGYFVSENNIDSKELQDMLRSKLPDYMIPKCFEQIGGIPLTANEKVDRNKLPKPEFKTKQIGKCIDPRTVKEKEVLKIWKEVLNLSDIGIYDDFYEMGGDSLSAMKVFSKLTQKYQISIKELYLYRNIASLSKMLRKKEPQIYFDFLKNQFKEMEHVLQYPTTEYLESYRNYLEKIDKDYNEIELETEEEYRTMLFIGATGFLGSHILYEFLSNTDVEIYAIIRGQSKESAGKRLRETLEFFDKYNPAWEQRIHVVVGDASIPKFGLEEETYEILRSKVDCIFNCAAIVSHLGLYEVMYKSNVLTCSNILKFAEKKKNIKIFHISTKHVGFGSVPDKKEVLFSESEFNVGQVIDNNYAKTKYEAETLMRAARDEGYNINIFRMGNISCELKGGKFQKNIEQNAFYILTRSFLRLGILPLSEQKTVDLTYVDSAARAIYLLATRKNLNNETYHIENTELLSFTHMGKMIQKYGENVVLRPYEDMWDYFLPIYEEGTDNSKMQEINNLIAYIDFLPWHMPTMFRFVKDKTKILLEKMGFAWKEPDQEIIDNLLDYGKQVGFFD